MKEDYPRPSVTVDLVIFTIAANDLKVLLIRRDGEPFKGYWALPGGFVGIDESLEDAAARELQEEASVKDVYLGSRNAIRAGASSAWRISR
jgi:8-oxo-dGTP diphosphatase